MSIMKEKEKQVLKERFANRDLMRELKQGIDHPPFFANHHWQDYYRWLCLASYERINNNEESI